jgi:hypothetical protein
VPMASSEVPLVPVGCATTLCVSSATVRVPHDEVRVEASAFLLGLAAPAA